MLYLLLMAFFMLPFSFSEEVEEVIVTGTILKNSENNDPTLKVLTNSAFNELQACKGENHVPFWVFHILNPLYHSLRNMLRETRMTKHVSSPSIVTVVTK